MPTQCPSCKLLFGTRNELDWHIREEHMESSLPARTRPADVTTAAGRLAPVTIGTPRAARDDPPLPPDPSEPNAARTAPGGPLAWLRRLLRPSRAASKPPR
jgi:hypothetical protein